MIHRKVYFRKHEHNPEWIYLDIFGCQVFACLGYGGWAYLNTEWFKTQLTKATARRIRVLRRRFWK